jgi:hypothetical protein
MRRRSIPELYRELLARNVERMLDGAWRARKGGEFHGVRAGGAASGGAAAAFLATRDVGLPQYVGSQELLDYATAAGDAYCRQFVRDGRRSRPSWHFSTTFFIDLYALMAPRLSAARRRRWQATALAHCEAIDRALALKFAAPLRGVSALDLGCGPNHVYLWCAMLYAGGLALDRPDFGRRAQEAIGRLIRGVTREGYHPEHLGPVLGYHALSASGLATYYHLSRDPRCRAPLKRAARFWCGTIYPNLHAVELFDERTRYNPNYGIAMHGAFALIPEGRRLIRLTLEKLLAHRREPVHPRAGTPVCWLLRGMLQFTPGPEKKLAVERSHMTSRIGREGLMRRKGPWFFALSAFVNEPWEHNPYILERTQHLAVWHERTGLLIGGGNDKDTPELATFHAIENKEVHYYRARRAEIVNGGRAPGVALDYGPILAELRVKPMGPRRLHLSAELRHWVLDLKPAFNLQLRLRPGEITLAGGRVVRLTSKPGAPKRLATGGLVRGKRFEIRCPEGATLLWPHFSHHTRIGHKVPNIADATAILSIPIPDDGGAVSADVIIRGG